MILKLTGNEYLANSVFALLLPKRRSCKYIILSDLQLMTDSVQLMLIPLEHWVSHEKSQYTVQQYPKTFPGPGKTVWELVGKFPRTTWHFHSASVLLLSAQWKLRLFYNRIYVCTYIVFLAVGTFSVRAIVATYCSYKDYILGGIFRRKDKAERESESESESGWLDLTHWPKLAPRKMGMKYRWRHKAWLIEHFEQSRFESSRSQIHTGDKRPNQYLQVIII